MSDCPEQIRTGSAWKVIAGAGLTATAIEAVEVHAGTVEKSRTVTVYSPAFAGVAFGMVSTGLLLHVPGAGMPGPVQQYSRLGPRGLVTESVNVSRSHSGPLDMSTGVGGSGWMVKLVEVVSVPQTLVATKVTVC